MTTLTGASKEGFGELGNHRVNDGIRCVFVSVVKGKKGRKCVDIPRAPHALKNTPLETNFSVASLVFPFQKVVYDEIKFVFKVR